LTHEATYALRFFPQILRIGKTAPQHHPR
jgi:hypothetical protein